MADAMRNEAMNRTAIRLCAEWVHWCIDNGWNKDQSEFLEDVFWKCAGWKTFKGYTRPTSQHKEPNKCT